MVNYLGIFLAGLSGFILCFIWNQPKVFGNALIRAMHERKAKPEEKICRNISSLCIYLVMAFMLEFFFNMCNVTTYGVAMIFTSALWVGFIATTSLRSCMCDLHPYYVWIIKNGQYLVMLLIMAAVLIAV